MPSGRPDWFGTIVAAGKYGTKYIAIELDESGAILALMKGAHDSVPKTIAVDNDGVMKANISVQDLAELITRPKYGAANAADVDLDDQAPGPIQCASISGKGMLYWGFIGWEANEDHYTDQLKITVDGNLIMQRNPYNALVWNRTQQRSSTAFLERFDAQNYQYGFGFSYGLTFETTLLIEVLNNGSSNIDIEGGIIYAKV